VFVEPDSEDFEEETVSQVRDRRETPILWSMRNRWWCRRCEQSATPWWAFREAFFKSPN